MDSFVQERWSKDKEFFEKRVQELKGQVLIDTANGDAELQYQQAKKLLETGVNVLVVIPVDQNKADRIVTLAHRYGVPVISYDRLIRNCDLDAYVSFDNMEVGQMQADYLARVCPKGIYAIIGGPVSDHNSFMIKTGQLNVLGPLIDKGDIKVVCDEFVDRWDRNEGYRVMHECLKVHPKIDAVLVANDDLATGVVQALNEKKLAGKVWVTGQDADLLACQRILSGTQVMTVYKPIEAIATRAAEMAMNMARKESPKNLQLRINNGKYMIPALLLAPMVVNRETIKLTVVADGYLEENKIRK